MLSAARPCTLDTRCVSGHGRGRRSRASSLVVTSASTATRGDKAVGIDLGTTNSAVAVVEGGVPTIVSNKEGGRLTPSVVAFNRAGERLVGAVAKRQTVLNAQNSFSSVKRFIGRKFSEVQGEDKNFAIEEGASGNVKLKCPQLGRSFAPEEISAEVLRKLASDASAFMGREVKRAVITVPAYFNDAQRQATKDAGRIAGLDVLRIINEPTAAALAYGLDKKENETVLVFDLGGGTFDVSLLCVGGGVFEVLATSGDTHLGGDDFDRRIVDWLADDFKALIGVDLRKDRSAMQRLTEAAVKAKEELSNLTSATINIPFVTATQDGPQHIDTTLTRAKFEMLCEDLFDRCKGPLQRAIEDSKLSVKDLDDVVMVGGSTRIPRVQAMVRELTGKAPNVTVNPDEVVALGAAVQAAVLSGELKDIVLLDVTPLSLGVETLGGVATKLIPRNTATPTSKTETFSTATDGQTSVEINVIQGEREFAKDNKSLGLFRLSDLPPAPRGLPKIVVTFDLSADGILQVSAMERASGKSARVDITGASTLSEADVAKATREAELCAEDDKRRRAVVDARNEAEALLYSCGKTLQQYRAQISASVAQRVEEGEAALRAALEHDDAGRIRALSDELRSSMTAIGKAVYEAQGGPQGGPQGGQGGPPPPQPPGGPDIEAEFTPVPPP